MKQEFDKEIDSLLRGASARARATSSASHASAHLATDELSAYAENALPPAARARYTAHIADCDQCRRIVAGIAIAAGAEVFPEERRAAAATVSEVQPAATPTTPAGFGAWLAALLSPGVLRFALPVLAVAIVGVLGLVVMQRRGGRNDATQVAQQSPAETTNNASITRPEQTSVPANVSAVPDANLQTEAASNSKTDAERSAGERPVTGPATPESKEAEADLRALSKSAEDAAPPTEAAAVVKDETKSVTQSMVTNLPAPATAAPKVAAQREVARLEPRQDTQEGARKAAPENEKREEAELAKRSDDDEFQPRDRKSGPSRNMERNVGRKNKAGETEPKGDYSTRRAGPGLGGASNTVEARRNVAGHEFRRRGDEWVDVNYRDSMAVSHYRRDTEGFRALVADVPEIGRIAEQLQGAVVVVARGRAYRIQ